MYENTKIYNYENIQIWKCTNMQVEKYKCEKYKKVCKESKYKESKIRIFWSLSSLFQYVDLVTTPLRARF